MAEHSKKSKGFAFDANKILGVIKDIFTWAIVILAVGMMIFTIISVATFDRNDRDIFGYKAFIVRSDSMAATDFKSGDLVIIKEVDPSTLDAGDIIAFTSQDESSFGETFTHKIRSRTTTEDGRPAFITYGTTTNTDDATPVTYEYILGEYQFAIPGVGTFFTFLKTVPGYICCIFLPFLILIIIQGVNSIKLFRQYKKEEMEEIESKRKEEMDKMAEEREKLAAEREASQRMMEELRKMQEKLSGEPAPAPEAAPVVKVKTKEQEEAERMAKEREELAAEREESRRMLEELRKMQEKLSKETKDED